MTQIDVSMLRRVSVLLFDHIEQSGSTLNVDADFYWNIPAASTYDRYSRPTDLDVGQLSDDLLELARIDAGEAPPIGYALVWLAAVVRAVGEVAVG